LSNLRFAGIAGCFSPTCIPEASFFLAILVIEKGRNRDC
jgi:hypothetical protein